MELTLPLLFDYEEQNLSPEIDPGRVVMVLAISNPVFAGGSLDFGLHLSFLVPVTTAFRYENLHEAIVLVFNDIHSRQSRSVRTKNEFIRYPERERAPGNLLSEPPFPLLPYTPDGTGGFEGGHLNSQINLTGLEPSPESGVYVHAVLENLCSNVVAVRQA